MHRERRLHSTQTDEVGQTERLLRVAAAAGDQRTMLGK